MTAKDAIKNIKGLLDGCCGPELDDTREAFGMAIKALEKQIPKQPNNCIWYGDGSAMGHCPMCDTFLDSDSDAHCYGCGQAILWSEGEG